jgi:hypothetical protein
LRTFRAAARYGGGIDFAMMKDRRISVKVNANAPGRGYPAVDLPGFARPAMSR